MIEWTSEKQIIFRTRKFEDGFSESDRSSLQWFQWSKMVSGMEKIKTIILNNKFTIEKLSKSLLHRLKIIFLQKSINWNGGSKLNIFGVVFFGGIFKFFFAI